MAVRTRLLILTCYWVELHSLRPGVSDGPDRDSTGGSHPQVLLQKLRRCSFFFLNSAVWRFVVFITGFRPFGSEYGFEGARVVRAGSLRQEFDQTPRLLGVVRIHAVGERRRRVLRFVAVPGLSVLLKECIVVSAVFF